MTLGPVGEPYLEAFVKPDRFLERLFAGGRVAEAYFETLPWLSWKTDLLGDPLYRPFGRGAAGPAGGNSDE